jgi:hypothetical protein
MNPDILEKLKEKYRLRPSLPESDSGAEVEDVTAPAWKIMYVIKDKPSRLGQTVFPTKEACEADIEARKKEWSDGIYAIGVGLRDGDFDTFGEAQKIDPLAFLSTEILFMYPYPIV